jgi:hypothetical protein
LIIMCYLKQCCSCELNNIMQKWWRQKISNWIFLFCNFYVLHETVAHIKLFHYSLCLRNMTYKCTSFYSLLQCVKVTHNSGADWNWEYRWKIFTFLKCVSKLICNILCIKAKWSPCLTN